MRHWYLLSRILVIAEGSVAVVVLLVCRGRGEGPEASDRPFALPCSPALSSASLSEETSMANTAAAAVISSMAAEQLAAAL